MNEVPSPNGHDRIEVTRSMISQGQVLRLRLEHLDDTTVVVDVRIGDDDQPVGRLQGQVRIADMIPASRALASLIGGAAAVLGQANVSTAKRVAIERVRQKYPHAYDPWSAEDDEVLLNLYRDGVGNVKIARRFGRKPSAIKSRLEKVLPPEADGDEIESDATDPVPDWVLDDSPSRDH
jgi:hypothetical protein